MTNHATSGPGLVGKGRFVVSGAAARGDGLAKIRNCVGGDPNQSAPDPLGREIPPGDHSTNRLCADCERARGVADADVSGHGGNPDLRGAVRLSVRPTQLRGAGSSVSRKSPTFSARHLPRGDQVWTV